MPDPKQQLLAARATRRRFLTVSGAAAALALAGTLPRDGVATARRLRDYPFALGIASGDPLPDGVVLWTRLAPRPLQPFGGMEYVQVPVRWEVALDERFRRVVRRGTAVARPETAHSVHVDVRGLAPGHEYFYRFATREERSPVGRTRTAPAPWQRVRELSIAYASCQAWWEGFYSAYADLARSAPGSRLPPRRLHLRVRHPGRRRPARRHVAADELSRRDAHARPVPRALRALQGRSRTCRRRIASRRGSRRSTTTRSRTTGPTRSPSRTPRATSSSSAAPTRCGRTGSTCRCG